MSRTALLALASVIAAFGALLAILHAGHPVQAHLVHSDALYLPVLFDDLLRRGGSLADWYLTPAPYFFPDFPLYLLAWLGGSNPFEQTTLFALLQVTLLTGALWLVARKTLASGRVAAVAALTALFVWLGLHADDPFVRLFSSAHHYGGFVASLLLAALWLELDAAPNARRRRIVAAAVALLVWLTALSDALVLVQAVGPLLAAALLCRGAAPLAAAVRRAALLLLLPALAGMGAYRFVVAHPTRYKSKLGLGRLSANLDDMGAMFATLLGGRPLLAAALLLSLLAGLACILAYLRRKAPAAWPSLLARPLPRSLHLLLVFSTLACAATVAVMLLSPNVQPVPRYLIAALSWPLVSGVFALACLPGAVFRHASLGLALIFSGLLTADAWHARGRQDAATYFYPKQVACIDRALEAAGAHHGIAQYWDAKRIQALGRSHPTLAQYTGELTPMPWITSQRYFGAHYDFAIIADQEAPEFRLPRAQLTALNGEPLQTVTCGDRSVLLFGPGRLRTAPAGAH